MRKFRKITPVIVLLACFDIAGLLFYYFKNRGKKALELQFIRKIEIGRGFFPGW